MVWQLVTAYPDYLLQLTALLSDPIYRGMNVPRGRGEPILLIPGFLAGDRALEVMARWLTRIGYQVYFSGIQWNVDCPDKTGIVLYSRVKEITQKTGRPLVVIGHSLGGVLARFLGARCPKYVSYVIAIGSPIDGSMRVHPLIPLTFRMLQFARKLAGAPLPPCAPHLRCTCSFTRTAFSSLPESVGFTAIFSKQDEIVDWQACVDVHGENRQVSGQHLGLIVNREVYRVLAHTLATSCVPYSVPADGATGKPLGPVVRATHVATPRQVLPS